MAFKRKSAKDLIQSKNKLDKLKKELNQAIRRKNKVFKILNETLDENIAEKFYENENMEQNKGKFLKWLKSFKEAFGKQGMEWLLSEANRIKNIYDPCGQFPKSYYYLHEQLFKALKKDVEAIQYLDNINNYNGEYIDTLALLAGGMFDCNAGKVPAYRTF